jgi:hypothetical protein
MTTPPPSRPHDRISQLVERIGSASTAVRDQLGDRLDPADDTAMTIAAARLLDERCRLVVCGEFKRGKSSLLNALLKRPGLLPVDEDVATSVVTVVSWGATDGATVHTAEGPVTVGLDDLGRYVTENGNPENERGVRLVDVTIDADLLKNGLVLIDTPGVGGLNADHVAATLGLLAGADAVLAVTDAVEPLTSQELDFLHRIAEITDIVAYAVTKIDLVGAPDVIVGDVRAKAAARLAVPPDSLDLLPVSSARRLDALAEGDAALDEASGFAALESTVADTMVARVRAGQIGQAVAVTSAPVERAVALLRAERKAIRRREQSVERDALLADAEGLVDTLRGLRAPDAGWRPKLDKRIVRITADAQDTVRATTAELRETLTFGMLTDTALLDDPDEIGRRLVTGLTHGVTAAGRRLEQELNRALSDLFIVLSEHRLAQEVGAPEFESIEQAGLHVPHLPKTMWQKGGLAVEAAKDHAVKGALIGSFIGGALGFTVGALAGGAPALPAALAGAAIGDSIGLALGAIMASVSGWRRKLKKLRRKELRARQDELRALLLPFLEANERRAVQALADVGRNLRGTVPVEVNDRLGQELRTAEDAVERIRSAAKLNADQAKQRLAELAAELSAFGEVQTELAAVLADADAIAARPGRS